MVRASTTFAFRAGGEEECIGRVVDSGASCHLTSELSLFSGPLRAIHTHIGGIAGGLAATGVGTGRVIIDGVEFFLPRLLYVPGLTTTLLSMSELVNDGCKVLTHKVSGAHEMTIQTKSGKTATIHPTNGLYECQPASANAFIAVDGANVGRTHAGTLPLGELLHRRFGHHSWQSAKYRSRIQAAYGIDDLGEGHSIASCDACARTQMRQSFSRDAPTRPACRPLERVHFDFVPHLPVRGVGGYVGFVLLVDEYTDCYFAYTIRSKSELPAILASFKGSAERHFREKLGKVLWPVELAGLRSDGEIVNLSAKMAEWCDTNHILHEISAPYAQWQNGKVERAIQSVLQGSEAMRVAAGAPPSFWIYSVLAFVHTRNLLAMGAHPLSPWERWHMVAVPLLKRVARLRAWGSLCYRFIPKELRKKLQDRAEISVMLGYSSMAKAYIVRSLSTGVISISANVMFNETVFPMHLPSLRAFLDSQSIPLDCSKAFAALDDQLYGSSLPTNQFADLFPDGRLESPLVPKHASVEPSAQASEQASEQATHDQSANNLADGVASERVSEQAREPRAYVPPMAAPSAPLASPWSMPLLEPLPALAPPPTTPARLGPAASGSVRSSVQVIESPAEWPLPSTPPSHQDDCRAAIRAIATTPPRPRRRCAPPNKYTPNPTTNPTTQSAPSLPAMPELSVQMLTRQRIERDCATSVAAQHVRSERSLLPLLPPSPMAEPTARHVALRAALLSIPPPPPPVRVRDNGEVVIPPICPSAKIRLSLSRRAQALVSPTAAQLTELESAAQSHVFAPQLARASIGRGPSPVLAKFEAAMLADAVRHDLPAPELFTEESECISRYTPVSQRDAASGINAGGWQEAMAAELRSMEEFGVWELVPPDQVPHGCKPLGNKWVFKIKMTKDGLVERLKARLTLQGFRMREGRDFGETWAPTGRLRTFRAMLAEAAGDGDFKTAQWDCTCAFLHAFIDKPVYMRQPPGTAKPGQEDYVCRLIKAIYGTRQASRLFGQLVHSTLLSIGDEASGVVVTQSKIDDCLYVISRGDERMRVLVHADDFAVTQNSDSLYDHIFGRMQEVFKITDYDRAPISHYCGLGVHRAADGSYELSQEGYIREVLDRLGMHDCKPAESPERTGPKAKLRPLSRELTAPEQAFMAQVPYREAVGAIWYIARATRFDIFRATQEVARFVSNPGPEHWTAVERLLRYLSKTASTPLVYRAASFTDHSLRAANIDARLVGHSDSDWAGDPDTSKSRTGWLVHFGGCLVAWRSVIQTSTSQSSCEAEYVAAAALANELVWWRQLCVELGHPMRGATPIRCDSEAAVGLAKHSGNFEATKHIRLKYHVLREYQAEGQVRTVWCPAYHQWADILTKNVAVHTFKRVVGLVLGKRCADVAFSA